MAFLSSLSIDIAVPCLSLSALIISFSPQENPDWWHLPLYWIGFAAVAFALSVATSFIVSKENRGEFTISLFFQNGLFFPIIILSGLFGTQNPYLAPLFLFTFLHPTLMFSTYPYFFRKGGQVNPAETAKPGPRLVLRRLINPVLVATIIGLFISLVGISAYVPAFVILILTMVGAMASPLFMLILGGTVYNDLMTGGSGKTAHIYFGDYQVYSGQEYCVSTGISRHTGLAETGLFDGIDNHITSGCPAGDSHPDFCRTFRW